MPDYRELDAARIVATLDLLARRVGERFPGSSLEALSGELLTIATECRGRLDDIRRPAWRIRIPVGLTVALLAAVIVAAFSGLSIDAEVDGLVELVSGIEAAVNDVVFLALAIFFLFTIEGRVKRRRALAALHELRSIAHIVDMHQLTKDPEKVLNKAAILTPSSPRGEMTRFELARYLDYCSELLSLVGKIAALHAQYLPDPVVLGAVNEIEDLTTGLARKIWQKITILDTIGELS